MAEVYVATLDGTDDTADGLADALDIREQVFVEEQGVPTDLERDGREESAVHFLACTGEEPVGTARLRTVDAATGKVERVAVLPSHREEGVGRRLMETLESTARDRGFDRLELHAQLAVEGFYHALGYETVSDVFEEADMPHVAMEKHLE